MTSDKSNYEDSVLIWSLLTLLSSIIKAKKSVIT